MDDREQQGLEHAWRYFALHAEQRMTVFNFYVASVGLALTGLAWVLAEGSRKWPLGVAAGVGAVVLSCIFWRLDQRGAQLVKVAEDAMIALERSLPSAAAITSAEHALVKNRTWLSPTPPWTFGRSFRLLFTIGGTVGLVGAVLTAILGISAKPQAPRAAVVADGSHADTASAPRGGSSIDAKTDSCPRTQIHR